MRCEVVAVGTELLLGQIVDSNSAWIGARLAEAGIDSHFQVKVGDNLERIVAALLTAIDRSDAVICWPSTARTGATSCATSTAATTGRRSTPSSPTCGTCGPSTS